MYTLLTKNKSRLSLVSSQSLALPNLRLFAAFQSSKTGEAIRKGSPYLVVLDGRANVKLKGRLAQAVEQN